MKYQKEIDKINKQIERERWNSSSPTTMGGQVAVAKLIAKRDALVRKSKKTFPRK